MSGTERVQRPQSFKDAIRATGGLCAPLPVMGRHLAHKHSGHKEQEAAQSPANQPDINAQRTDLVPQDAEMQTTTLKFAHAVGREVNEMDTESGERVYGEGDCWADRDTALDAMAFAVRGAGLDDVAAISPAELETQARAYAEWVAENYLYYGYVSQGGEAVHRDAAKPEKDATGKEIDKIVETGKGIRTMAEISREITLGITFAGAVSGSVVNAADWLMKRTAAAYQDELNEGRAPVPTDASNSHVVSAYAFCAGRFETLAKYLNGQGSEMAIATREKILVRAEAMFRNQVLLGRVRIDLP